MKSRNEIIIEAITAIFDTPKPLPTNVPTLMTGAGGAQYAEMELERQQNPTLTTEELHQLFPRENYPDGAYTVGGNNNQFITYNEKPFTGRKTNTHE